MHDKLSAEQVEADLVNLPGWSLLHGKLHREFKFDDFADAIKFMDQVFQTATTLNHHPELFNVYNRVSIDLSTHEVGGITPHDIDLARAINAVFRNQA